MATRTQPRQDAIWTALSVLLLLALVLYLSHVLLLFFAGALLALVFRAPAEGLARRSGMDARLALGIVLTLIVAVLSLTTWLLGHTIAAEFAGVGRRLPEAIEALRARMDDAGPVANAVESAARGTSPTGLLRGGLATLSATFDALTSVGLVLFAAVLIAAQPDLYVRGALHLLPKPRRQRAGEVLSAIGDALRRWLLGQLFLMALVAVLTYGGLRLIGVEYAGGLSLLAGLLSFVPYLGPLLAGAIAVLIALAQGPQLALLTAGVAIGVQLVEGIFDPFVQQRSVYLAPALVLFAQAAMGALTGLIGVVIATPLAAAAIVIIKMLYVEDTLGDHEVRGES
jgi:predicted PurR-regulated permease PerM